MGVSDEIFLRIGVKSGGCSGNSYDAVLDDNMQEVDDVYYTEDKLRIVSDKVSSIYLDGLTIDFSDDLEIISEKLRRVSTDLGKIVGNIDIEEILDNIFSSFCIGK